jgi:hypothetical protein
VLCVHAAPGRDDGMGFHPGLTDAEMAQFLGGCDAGLILVGHSHQAMDVTVDGTRVVNVGSVSNPVAPDLRADYVLLQATPSGYQLEHCRVDHDRGAAVAVLRRMRHPGARFIIGHLEGHYQPSPKEDWGDE